MKRHDRIREAKIAFPAVPGNLWMHIPSAEIDSAIESGILPAKIIAMMEAQGSDTSAMQSHEPIMTAKNPRLAVPEVKAGSIESAIQALISASTPKLDEERVKELISESLKDVQGITATTFVLPESKAIPTTITNHHEILPRVVKRLNSGLHVMLYGPQGTGKTTIGFQAAQAMQLNAHPDSFCPTKDDVSLFGFIDANGAYHDTPFRRAYQHGGLWIGDEIDNSDPSIAAGLNLALANSHCQFPDALVERHANFRAIICANTAGMGPEAGYLGRTALDGPFLDRFVRLHVDIDTNMERACVKAILDDPKDWLGKIQSLRAANEALRAGIVISPRVSIHGAKIIASGESHWQALCETCFAGMEKSKIQNLCQRAGITEDK